MLTEVSPKTMVYVQDGLFPYELCDLIVQRFDEDTENQHPGYTLSGENPAKVSTDINIKEGMPNWDGFWRDIDHRVHQLLNMAWIGFCQDVYDFSVAEIGDSGYQLQRYPAREGRYGWHIDGGLGVQTHRQVAIIVYLNDVDKGGETEFKHQGVRVEAKKGRLAMFPSFWTHEHRGRVPLSGDKYILTSFMQTPEQQAPHSHDDDIIYEKDYDSYVPDIVVAPFTPEDPHESFDPFEEMGLIDVS